MLWPIFALVAGVFIGVRGAMFVLTKKHEPYRALLNSITLAAATKQDSEELGRFEDSLQASFKLLSKPRCSTDDPSESPKEKAYRTEYHNLKRFIDATERSRAKAQAAETLSAAEAAYQSMLQAQTLVELRSAMNDLEHVLKVQVFERSFSGGTVHKPLSLREDLGHPHDDVHRFFEECVRRIVN